MDRYRVNMVSTDRTPHYITLLNFLTVLVIVLGGLFLLIPKAPAQTATPQGLNAQGNLITPNETEFGTLLFESTTPGYYVKAPLVATDVVMDITGPIARTKVTQRFTNPSKGWVEGKYVYPLPEDAAVDTLRMQIGDRFIEGQIKEKGKAKIIYETAKAKGYKASLVEQERPNIFTNSVANIGPGETIIVQIEYQESVRLDNGLFSLRFPMVVAPRYNPAPKIQMVDFDGQGWGTVNDPVPDRANIEPPYVDPAKDPQELRNPVTLVVNLNAGFPLETITSTHHNIIVQREHEEHAILTLKEGEVKANKDFELTWTAKAGTSPHAALFKETINGEEYILAYLVPPQADEDTISRPRETIFVIDNSGSMGGESIRQAKAALLLALDQLESDDTFNIIRFDNTFELVFPRAVQATPVNVASAKGFVSALDADGGTEMLPALEASLIDHTPTDTDRVRQVIFLTDGAIGNEAQLFAAIRQGLGRSRLFTVGIGSAPNSYFMSRAARMGRGTFTHIGNTSQVTERMAVLFDKLENPVMTDLVANWTDNINGEAWPNPLPDLYSGEPVVITAKMDEAKGKLLISGNLNNDAWLAELNLRGAAFGKGVSKLWARKKIASIEESRFDGMPWQQIDDAVLKTALGHHLVSRLTSLVAVDVTPSRPDGENLTTRDVPLNLPEGWDFDKVFGTDILDPEPTPLRDATLDTGIELAGLAVADENPALTPQPPAPGLALPQGATTAELRMGLGLLMLLGTAALLWQRGRFASPSR